jgi:hypothetical protein
MIRANEKRLPTLRAIIAAVTIIAVIGCSVQKKEETPSVKTPLSPVSSSSSSSVSDTGSSLFPPATCEGTAADSGKVICPPESKATLKTPVIGGKERTGTSVSGGERDSATQPVFELGADGKMHRIKR